MGWLWWVVLGAAGLILVNVLRARSKPPPPNPLNEIFQPVRDRNASVTQEVSKVTRWILEMEVNPTPRLAASEVLDGELIRQSVEAFLKGPLSTGISTSTPMVHVANTENSVILIAKLRPDKKVAASREFERVSATAWHVRTRKVDDFDVAVDRFQG
ncbi:MAG: hypothetical protein Q8L84_12615 [Hyphomonas sp.]|nr:hypothetical protein [Hyphomonas sp.]